MPGVAITALTDGSDAVAAGSIGAVSLSRATGFNGSTYDRIRTLGGTSLNGLGQLAVSGGIPGASVVTSFTVLMPATNTTRQTLVTPSGGKRIRLISCQVSSQDTSTIAVEVYFATGANIGSTVANAIGQFNTGGDAVGADSSVVWPDGAGPVGAADALLSARNAGSVAGNKRITVHYREE